LLHVPVLVLIDQASSHVNEGLPFESNWKGNHMYLDAAKKALWAAQSKDTMASAAKQTYIGHLISICHHNICMLYWKYRKFSSHTHFESCMCW
jgi:hypothetical protein